MKLLECCLSYVLINYSKYLHHFALSLHRLMLHIQVSYALDNTPVASQLPNLLCMESVTCIETNVYVSTQ